MTILVVNDFAYVYGGASQVALASACELSRRGHRVILFAAVGPAEPTLLESGVEVVCLEQAEAKESRHRLQAVLGSTWNQTAARQMRSLLSTLSPQDTIVHIHGWFRRLSASVLPVIEELGFSAVLTLHDYFAACPNGGFFDYPSQQICHREPLHTRCLVRNCGPGSYAEKLWRVGRTCAQKMAGLPRNIKAFISVSSLSEEILRPFLPRDASVFPVSNPIDLEREAPTSVAFNRVFASVGRLIPVKGVLLAAEAARRSGSALRAIGDGDLRPALEENYPEVEITGWKTQAETKALLKQARSLVFSPLWYETLGLVVLEAAALGIPALVANTSAARDLVVDGVTGYWFRSGDAEDLAAKMKLFHEDDRVRTLGHNAWEKFWSDPPTLSRHADQLELCYTAVMRSQGKTR